MDWCSNADITPVSSFGCRGMYPWSRDSANHTAGSGWGQRTQSPVSQGAVTTLHQALAVCTLKLSLAAPGNCWLDFVPSFQQRKGQQSLIGLSLCLLGTSNFPPISLR